MVIFSTFCLAAKGGAQKSSAANGIRLAAQAHAQGTVDTGFHLFLYSLS
jgi:hypothetical protein